MFLRAAIWNPQAGGGRPPRQPGQVRKEAAVTGCVRVAVLSALSHDLLSSERSGVEFGDERAHQRSGFGGTLPVHSVTHAGQREEACRR